MADQSRRADAWLKSQSELSGVGGALNLDRYEEFAARFDLIDHDHVSFFTGQGRSGLAVRMIAMRFMHMGLEAAVVGEATAPSIQAGDTLVVVSGSGKTPVSLNFARVAKDVGATVLAVTHQDSSELRDIADASLVLPVAGTEQFGGTLFEQSALILLDSIVIDQMVRRRVPHEFMARRHTNFL